MTLKNNYKVIGIMSGTSLDGLDLAYCSFSLAEKKWTFNILSATTLKYAPEWKEKLVTAYDLSGFELIHLDKSYGSFIGNQVRKFIDHHNIEVDLIASHGHTVFHQPEKGITYQIGHGENIAAETGITTVSDFRSLDVIWGGQGAPLVPAGDELLFHDYDYCLNLGGFSNISYRKENNRIAFDICPVNIILNHLCPPFDQDGRMGQEGNTDADLLKELNNIAFYRLEPPKSLGREWLAGSFIPVINKYDISVKKKLRTVYEHITDQISVYMRDEKKKVLVTGGGAFNSFLIDLLKEKSGADIILPEKKIIEYKEALIFAFLGILRERDEINVWSSVTGASRDTSSGILFRC